MIVYIENIYRTYKKTVSNKWFLSRLLGFVYASNGHMATKLNIQCHLQSLKNKILSCKYKMYTRLVSENYNADEKKLKII